MPVSMATVDGALRSEIVNLFSYVQRLREELATIAHRPDSQTAFESVSDQLDAIVSATEHATDTILESVENIEAAVEKLRSHPDDKTVDSLCDLISNKTMDAIEACSFQDITGQRVTKVIRSMRFVEERVQAMAEIWGRDEIAEIGASLPVDQPEGDEALLNGPQLAADANTQDEIDKLFD